MSPEAESCAKDIRRSAMNLLARRERGFNELVNKLKQRFSKEEVVTQIDRLREEGLQCDHRFVESFINYRQQRGYGPIRLRMDLLQRQVESELIDEYLDQNDESWYEQAYNLKQRKFGSDCPTDYRQRAKQLRYLIQRGFTVNQANKSFL